MSKTKYLYRLLYIYVTAFVLAQCGYCVAHHNPDRQLHIVYMGAIPDGTYSPSSHHLTILQDIVDHESVAESLLLRSYQRSFNGFAAYLSHQERQRTAGYEGIVSVFKSRTLQLQTTRSWDFMGFPENVHRNPSYESNIIIGVIDSGIWPESPSFTDKNFGPLPTKWKGVCHGGKHFSCNKKLIGARYYSSTDTARDMKGHGTHTASTAAGNYVGSASFYGLANGTARGGVPSARIAAYQACGNSGCNQADILAAFDDAIADGVDIITISIGYQSTLPIHKDAIAIGAFHATQRGILTVQAAGNGGNSSGTVTSVVPWILSVAASSTDRQVIDKLVLGNGKTLIGRTINSFNLNSSFPLISGQDGTDICKGEYAETCGFGCLKNELVKGKILLCRSGGVLEAASAGALGVVYDTDAVHNFSAIKPIPASVLSTKDISVVEAYLKSTIKPEANILKSQVVIDLEAPVVPYFSSRGPNKIIPEILKPDITAPGVSILAAYSPAGSPSDKIDVDKRSVNYSILSGTSMACPHVAGAAAYVKSLHPRWSASAIQSSLITTTQPMNASKNQDAEFAYGSGHLDPVKAANPGLVYETTKEDYVRMLCSIGFNTSKVRTISGDNSSCPKRERTGTAKDLNYPTMAIKVTENKRFTVSFPRTVTNVGSPNSTYKAYVSNDSQLGVSVKPNILAFKSLNEKKSFTLVVSGRGFEQKTRESASLVWSDGIHIVRSPIVVYT